MSTAIPGENGNGDDGAPALFGAAAPAPAQPQPQPQPQPSPPFTPPQLAQNESRESEDGRSHANDSKPPPVDRSTEKRETESPEQKEPDRDALKQTQVASISESAATPPAPPAQPQSAKVPSPPGPSASTGGGKPGPNVAPADPAPQSDSESDPFTKDGAVQFKRGATDVQFGRQHKIIRPRLGLAGEADLMNLRDPIRLVLALTLDEHGKVISVDILKSSGSRNVDQACKVAAYQWWIEPSKDKSGKPVRDVVPFVIGFS